LPPPPGTGDARQLHTTASAGCSLEPSPFGFGRLSVYLNESANMPNSNARSAFVHAVVTEIQLAAGAAAHATPLELVEIFSRVADRIGDPVTQVDRMVLRRILASAIRHIYVHAGIQPPLRPVVNQIADADDPRAAFKAALEGPIRTAALRSDPSVRRGSRVRAS
jgi:hypothetical protein